MYNFLASVLISPLLMMVGVNYFSPVQTVNYYGIPLDLTFNKIKYELSWSAHPNESYYKQEYVAHGETTQYFSHMVLIDFIITDMPAKDIAQSQIDAILERKKTDPVCNYQIMKNPQTGEYILDFTMSEGNNNQLTTIEWDAYHYKPYTDKMGHKGVLLMGVSERAYNDRINDFLKSLKNYRHEIIQKLSDYTVPKIQVK